MKKVLIAGGAGFIGSNLAHRLVAQGVHVEAVDNFLTGEASNLPTEVVLHELDCASDKYRKKFQDQDWDAIIHFAGASSVPLFEEEPMYVAQAVEAFQNSLEIARATGAKVAFASTSSFYARCEKPYREDMQVTAGTLYECSKLAMEDLGCAYAARYGVPTVALRFFSVYGPRERGKGRLANVVSQFMWGMKAGQAPVLYGDGEQTRDFTYVDDLLDGLLLALENVEGFQVYNIGTGIEHTFNQVVQLLNKTLETDIPPKHIPNPIRNYVQETMADNSRLQALGWKPKTQLPEGLHKIAQLDGPVDERLLERIQA